MTTAVLAIALTRMGMPSTSPADLTRARILAVTIASAARAHGIPPLLLAAVAAHETRFDRSQIGAAGERGRWQTLPKTAHAMGYHVTPEALANDPINADVAAAYLAHVRAICVKRGATSDAAMLDAYRGIKCRAGRGVSRYARQILDLAGMARALAGGPAPTATVAYFEKHDGAATPPVATGSQKGNP